MTDLNRLTNLDTKIQFLEACVLPIDSSKTEDEMTKVAAHLAYANACEADAHRDYLWAKMELERTEARLMLMLQATEKLPKHLLEAKMKNSEDWHEAMKAKITAEATKKRMQGFAFALAAKRDMLTSIGMRINAELRADPLAAAQSRGERIARGG